MTAPTQEEAVSHAQKLMAQKTALEAQIVELEQVLTSQGTDLTSPLTDASGYPRSDIDVYSVRHTRVALLRLRNDHTDLMRTIEAALQDVFKAGGSLQVQQTPFAKVGSVSPDSPAHEAGMLAGDEVVR
ncbi:hypothetical protein PhCBS80983_g00903 [Powellomyces hirtus]|uniref:Nas2 N-terminal domain-containing protein n=1 Tax=Powellomyces hirtus TaxID=109895 RepID=A0A507EEI7_9FUNG|nr:hypothetical protein PhCBS80983_g00903 [Powellomyces hirtus]